jgi:PEGA domain.
MKNTQENKLSMYLTVKEFSPNHSDITANLPDYSTNFNNFVEATGIIQMLSGVQKTGRKGITDRKNQLRMELRVLVADYARKLISYAKLTGNLELQQEVHFSESTIKTAADTAVLDYAQIVMQKAGDNLASLTAYGISESTQNTLGSLMESYQNTIGKPGASRAESTQITQQLSDYFKKADEYLYYMDLAVEIVRLSEPVFYHAYRNARKIIDNGTGSLAVKGFVTEQASGEPVKGATLLFTPLGEDGALRAAGAMVSSGISKKTAKKGGYNIKSLPEGVYQVVVKKVGYEEQVTQVAIAAGERTTLDVVLQRK